MIKKIHRLDMRLTEEQQALLERLMKKKAIGKGAVVNLAIKELADRELVKK
jgi:hypothetical protein